jgi:hypothetical protein
MTTNRGDVTANGGDLLFQNLGTNKKIVFSENGPVGIGATSPGYLLDIRNSSNSNQLHLSGTGNDDGGYILGYGGGTAGTNNVLDLSGGGQVCRQAG